ncbi:primase-helicase zinc-binding domain-containing protein [Endozoicomonas lisbonensis]|uniref:Phage/plasmid primase-like uncharacterized protein n=1 Tax=Endozoicomonas lisbonensis TaxID=3120522 RepID=A0ABV2SN75_9GAMM
MRIEKDIVDAAAYGKWGEILQSIYGLSPKETTPTKKGMSCPHCGGNDRYEYKDHANGLYFCRGCEAGDGYSMIMKIHDCGFVRALEMVASWLNLTHTGNHFDFAKIKVEYRVKRERRAESERIITLKAQRIAAQKASYEYSTSTNPDPFHPIDIFCRPGLCIHAVVRFQ